jgi:hypothetical protein
MAGTPWRAQQILTFTVLLAVTMLPIAGDLQPAYADGQNAGTNYVSDWVGPDRMGSTSVCGMGMMSQQNGYFAAEDPDDTTGAIFEPVVATTKYDTSGGANACKTKKLVMPTGALWSAIDQAAYLLDWEESEQNWRDCVECEFGSNPNTSPTAYWDWQEGFQYPPGAWQQSADVPPRGGEYTYYTMREPWGVTINNEEYKGTPPWSAFVYWWSDQPWCRIADQNCHRSDLVSRPHHRQLQKRTSKSRQLWRVNFTWATHARQWIAP